MDVTFMELDQKTLRVFLNTNDAKLFAQNECEFATHLTRLAGELYFDIERYSKDSMIKILEENEFTFETV